MFVHCPVVVVVVEKSAEEKKPKERERENDTLKASYLCNVSLALKAEGMQQYQALALFCSASIHIRD
jgi:hypothetical protein